MAFVLHRWRPHDEERHAAYYYASRRGLEYCVALSAVLNFDYLGECSHRGNRGRVAWPTSDENLRYITPGTLLVNEAPPMPLTSHLGSPNSLSCSALARYSCWPGLSTWGEPRKRTRVARTAALTHYRYATQPTCVNVQIKSVDTHPSLNFKTFLCLWTFQISILPSPLTLKTCMKTKTQKQLQVIPEM